MKTHTVLLIKHMYSIYAALFLFSKKDDHIGSIVGFSVLPENVSALAGAGNQTIDFPKGGQQLYSLKHLKKWPDSNSVAVPESVANSAHCWCGQSGRTVG